ncbi:hypothetical protein PROFUN_06391 [Planoprotostelium fungivorum]|uniref:Uncharacterized protein n=1 Tax=Planoprotostelium fungivorum TaxID=1890364 RepID=A0A2P6NNT1_9EUKA|nr:hypothetical protein PROFUN_06391 [Planoprotostelium fungivorum]
MQQLGEVENARGSGVTISRFIREIRERQIQPTHFLMVNFVFSRKLGSGQQQRIRQRAFSLINGRRFVRRMADDDEIHISWKSFNHTSSALYYAVSRYEETYVKQMTKALLGAVYTEIQQEEALELTDFGINYITTKNLEFTININNHQAEILGAVPATPASVDFENGMYIEADHYTCHMIFDELVRPLFMKSTVLMRSPGGDTFEIPSQTQNKKRKSQSSNEFSCHPPSVLNMKIMCVRFTRDDLNV